LPSVNETQYGLVQKGSGQHKFSIVGIGPGDHDHMTLQAAKAIQDSHFVVGYRPYLELIEDLLPGKEIISSSMGKEVDRASLAVDFLDDGPVALVSSGDPNVYGMAGLGLEIAARRVCLDNVEVVPGITSFTAAAGKAGLFFKESLAVISLSDLLTPWSSIEKRLKAAAEHHMPVALYNPRSRKRDWQLERALEFFGSDTDVLIAKNIAREKEEMLWTKAAELLDKEELRDRIDMFTILILGGCGIVRAEISRESLVNIVGIGPGSCSKLTFEAAKLLKGSAKIFGAKRYLHAIADIAQGQQITHKGSCAKRMTLRLQEARAASQQGIQTSILTGGDPSIFSSAWRIVHDDGGFSPHICSGISAFSAVAARAGAPLINDHIVLSDAENNSIIAQMLRAGFGIVAYNVASQDLSSLLQEIDPSHPCALARDVARDGETIFVDNASDILESKPAGTRFTLIVASANSYIKDGKIISRRGYQNKYIY
jgi:precorrin-3B C17-methyltransferase / cobalt-factor III methyltransferase